MRRRLVRRGLEVWTEHGYLAGGLEAVLAREGVPKGSFYHWFASKADFGAAIIDAYGAFIAARLERCLEDEARSPLARIADFVEVAARGMAKHDFRRGCLVGNLGHELSGLPEGYPEQLRAILRDWETRLAACLAAAREAGEIPEGADPQRLAEYFWIGWEGAVMRARLERSDAPLRNFHAGFVAGFDGYTP